MEWVKKALGLVTGSSLKNIEYLHLEIKEDVPYEFEYHVTIRWTTGEVIEARGCRSSYSDALMAAERYYNQLTGGKC